MHTITIDLGDGDSAELYAEMRHGTVREVERIYRPHFSRPEFQEVLKIESFEERQQALLPLMVGTEDMARATDVMLLNQIKAWTFGEVTPDILDSIPERKHQILVQEANKAYEAPLPESSVRS